MNEQETTELHRKALGFAHELECKSGKEDEAGKWLIRRIVAAVGILVQLREEDAAIIKSLREQLPK